MVAASVSNIKTERGRHDIEARYQRDVDLLLKHYDFNVRMMKMELQMQCHVVKTLRDAALRELEKDM